MAFVFSASFLDYVVMLLYDISLLLYVSEQSITVYIYIFHYFVSDAVDELHIANGWR